MNNRSVFLVKKKSVIRGVIILLVTFFFTSIAIYFQLNYSKDFDTYLNVFDSNSVIEEGTYNVEISANLISKTGFSPIFIIGLYVILGFYFKAVSFFSFKNSILNLFLYVTTFFLLFEGTAIRLSLAMGFILYGVSLQRRNNNLRAVIFFLLAFLFHYSTLVTLIYLLNWKKALIAIIGLCLCVYLFTFFDILNYPQLSVLIGTRFGNYMENKGESNTIFNSKFVYILFLIFIYVKNYKLFKDDESIIISLSALVFSFMSLFFNSSFFTRIVDIFLLLSVFKIVPYLLGKNIIEKLLLIFVACLTLFATLFRGWVIG